MLMDRPQCLWTDPMSIGRPQCLRKQRSDYKQTYSDIYGWTPNVDGQTPNVNGQTPMFMEAVQGL